MKTWKWLGCLFVGLFPAPGFSQSTEVLQSLQVHQAFESPEGYLLVDLQVGPSIELSQDSFKIDSKVFSMADHFFWRKSPGSTLNQLHLTRAKSLLSSEPHSNTSNSLPLHQFTAHYSDFQKDCNGRESSFRIINHARIEITSCLGSQTLILNAVCEERKNEIQNEIQNQIIQLEPLPNFRTPQFYLELPTTRVQFYIDTPAYPNGLPIKSYFLPKQTRVFQGYPKSMTQHSVRSIERKWEYLRIELQNGDQIIRYRKDRDEAFRFYYFESSSQGYFPLKPLALEKRIQLGIDLNEVNPSQIHTPTEIYLSQRSQFGSITKQPRLFLSQILPWSRGLH
jgi:hypothetical protein